MLQKIICPIFFKYLNNSRTEIPNLIFIHWNNNSLFTSKFNYVLFQTINHIISFLILLIFHLILILMLRNIIQIIINQLIVIRYLNQITKIMYNLILQNVIQKDLNLMHYTTFLLLKLVNLLVMGIFFSNKLL